MFKRVNSGWKYWIWFDLILELLNRTPFIFYFSSVSTKKKSVTWKQMICDDCCREEFWGFFYPFFQSMYTQYKSKWILDQCKMLWANVLTVGNTRLKLTANKRPGIPHSGRPNTNLNIHAERHRGGIAGSREREHES